VKDIEHLDEMSAEKLQEAARAIIAAWDAAVIERKSFMSKTPSRMNSAQKQRAAYLAGVVSGAARAVRAIESRAPMRLIGSGAGGVSAGSRTTRYELALHRIAGHSNITGDKARAVAAAALGEQSPPKGSKE
jgi:hypothetical protein